MLTPNPENGDLLITAIVGPKQALITFAVDTGAQISALTNITAQKCGIIPNRKRSFVLNALGTTEVMDIALVKILLPAEENQLLIKLFIGDIPNNLLGMDVLAGRQWEDEEGCLWSFGTPRLNVRLLQVAPPVLFSKITDLKQSPLPSGAKEGITPVIQEL